MIYKYMIYIYIYVIYVYDIYIYDIYDFFFGHGVHRSGQSLRHLALNSGLCPPGSPHCAICSDMGSHSRARHLTAKQKKLLRQAPRVPLFGHRGECCEMAQKAFCKGFAQCWRVFFKDRRPKVARLVQADGGVLGQLLADRVVSQVEVQVRQVQRQEPRPFGARRA